MFDQNLQKKGLQNSQNRNVYLIWMTYSDLYFHPYFILIKVTFYRVFNFRR